MIEHLPVELIRLICGHLCPHCQSPNAFPNADAPQTIHAKGSLSRLSRTSKALCAIAQPFVFHYYATGNLPNIIITADPGYSYDIESWIPEDDLLPSFLSSVIQRPDLAQHVQALQLAASCSVGMDGPHGPAFSAIERASVELGLVAYNMFHPDYMNWTPDRPDPKPERDPRTGNSWKQDLTHAVLTQLAILLCPNVHTLLIHGSFRRRFYCKLTLQALKTIGLLSEGRHNHYADAGPLLSLAPNLETIYAADLKPPMSEGRDWAPAWMGTFPAVTKLVLHDMRLNTLFSLPQAFPRLLDLQYTHTSDPAFGGRVTCRDIVAALEPLSKTLRRLKVLVLTEPEPDDDSNEIPVIETMRHFEKLEELTLNHVVIYGSPEPEEPLAAGTLAGFLPRSLVSLHISHVVPYVDPGFRDDLQALARDAPAELPNLRSVEVSCVSDLLESELFDVDTRDDLEDAFEEAGIELSWGVSYHGYETTDIPGLPVSFF